MVLNQEIKAQLQQYLTFLEGDLVIKISFEDDKTSQDMLELVTELSKNVNTHFSRENGFRTYTKLLH